MIEAEAMPEAFATAYLNLFIEGRIQELYRGENIGKVVLTVGYEE